MLITGGNRFGPQHGSLVPRALMHGGPLDDSWWDVPDGTEPPRLLVPVEGLGTAEPVLLADYPVHVSGWRYELEANENGRLVYVWSQDMRPEMEFDAWCEDGPAAGYGFRQFGLTEPWSYIRLAARPRVGPLDGGNFEWMHIPWPDGAPWPEEAVYELTGTVIPPGSVAQARYRWREDGWPYRPIPRSAQQ